MQQTEFIIETGGAKIKALDADGNGNFIALTETGEVIAHDFRVKLDPEHDKKTLAIKYSKIRRLDQDRFIIISSRTWDENEINAHVYNIIGGRLNSYPVGDGIEDVLICGEKMVVTYFDEGVFGGEGPNQNGLSVFSFDGELLYGYNEAYKRDNPIGKHFIDACYATCRIDQEHVAFYFYDSFLLLCLDLRDYSLISIPIPDDISTRIHVLSFCRDSIFAVLRYHYRERGSGFACWWWDNEAKEAEPIPERIQGRIKGIDGGKFLAQNDFGYTIIDPLALSVKETLKIGTRRLELVLDDITNQEVDALVNAANPQLAGGFGVDGAIHRRGGPAIMEETREKYYLGCPTGSAVPSNAGKLNAKYVFHAVGPRWFDDPERFDLLRSAYQRCLELVVELDCRSIAFPSISTGDFGFPVKESSVVAIETVCDFLRRLPDDSSLEFVRLCLFSAKDLETYRAAVDSCRDGQKGVK